MTEDATTPAPSEPVAGPVQRKLGHATEARWYCLDRDGVAMLCTDEADARTQAAESDDCWPGRAPHRAVLLGDVAALRARVLELEAAHEDASGAVLQERDRWLQRCAGKRHEGCSYLATCGTVCNKCGRVA
jgi:hypothetical protein